MSVTPQIYITSEIKNLLKNIEEKHNDDWCKTLLGKTENYKQYMSNLLGMRNAAFWTNFKN